jgi:hypothetical protein
MSVSRRKHTYGPSPPVTRLGLLFICRWCSYLTGCTGIHGLLQGQLYLFIRVSMQFPTDIQRMQGHCHIVIVSLQWLWMHLGTCRMWRFECISNHHHLKEGIHRYSCQYIARLSVHTYDLIVNYMAQTGNRRLRRHHTNDVPTRFLVCLCCSLRLLNSAFLIPTSHNRPSTYQLYRIATEHSSTCKSHSHKPQEA